MPNEKHQLPAVLVFRIRAPGWHAGKPDTVVNGVVDFPVGQILGLR